MSDLKSLPEITMLDSDLDELSKERDRILGTMENLNERLDIIDNQIEVLESMKVLIEKGSV